MSSAVVLFSAAAAAKDAAPAAKQATQSHPAACFAATPPPVTAADKQIRRRNHSYDAPADARMLSAIPTVATAQRGAIRRVALPPGSRKLIALTFDLCEQRGEIAGFDGEIFDVLRRERVRATLFAGGKWMRSHAERTAALMRDPQFELANHTDTHRNLKIISPRDRLEEIAAPQRVYESYRQRLNLPQCRASEAAPNVDRLPARLSLFRFPFGACNRAAIDAVNDSGLTAVQWDVSSGDPDPKASVASIVRNMVAPTKPGSIILAHANGRGWKTAKALEIAIPKLRQAGFEFVTVSDLLAAGTPVAADSCYDNRPGDTDRFDHFSRWSAHQGRADKARRTLRKHAPSKKH